MGFKLEGYERWQRILKETKQGNGIEVGDGRGPGRHSAMLAIGWDDWYEGGVKERVEQAMVLRKRS